jgi:hypothetical protein
MATDIKRIERRTAQSWFEDGIPEIGFALWIGWMGLILFGLAVFPVESTAKSLLDVGWIPAFILGAWLVNPFIRFLKRKLTDRRTGFVSPCPPAGKKRTGLALLSGGLSAVLAFLFVLLLRRLPSGLNTGPALAGLAIVLALIGLAYRTNFVRLVLVAGAVAGVGIVLSTSSLGFAAATAILLGATAAGLFVSGLITLAPHLRRYPIIDEERG